MRAVELRRRRLAARLQLLQLQLRPLARFGRLAPPLVHLGLLPRQLIQLGLARLRLALQLRRLQHPLCRPPLHAELHLGDALAFEPRLQLAVLHLGPGALARQPRRRPLRRLLLFGAPLLAGGLVLCHPLPELRHRQLLQARRR